MRQGTPKTLRLAVAAMLGVKLGLGALAESLPGFGQQTGIEMPRPSQVKLRKVYRSWQRSGRRGLPAPRAKHRRRYKPRSWRKARVNRLRARRHGRTS